MSIPHTAMVLAAGMGMRMRPLTLQTPKPLLEVGGRSMLDTVIDRLVAFGVQKIAVNAHWLPEKIAAHIKTRNDAEFVLSQEDVLLDTGGGVKNALKYLGDDPIFVVNSDLPWIDGRVSALKRLSQTYDAQKMDALLLVADLQSPHTHGFDKTEGDFFLGNNGQLKRVGTSAPRPYVFISAQMVQPQLFAPIPDAVFSTNRIWDAAEKTGRLYGLAHDAACYHVGTPADLAESNRLLASGSGW